MEIETTLGEQILLLSLDDATGAAKLQLSSEWMIAVAALADLVLAGRIEVQGEQVVVVDATPTGTPSLDAALSRIGTRDRPVDVQSWMNEWRAEGVAGARQGLLDKGLVREERKRVLGLFPTRRYPAADGTAEAAVQRSLADVVLHGQEPDPRTGALVVLLHGGDLRTLAFPDADPEMVRLRMEELSQGHWASPALKAITDSIVVFLTTYGATSTAVGLMSFPS
jgi:hypothetical protein